VWAKLDYELNRALHGHKTIAWIPTPDCSRHVVEVYKWPLGLWILKKLESSLRASNRASQKTLFVASGLASQKFIRVGLEATGCDVDSFMIDVRFAKCDSKEVVNHAKNIDGRDWPLRKHVALPAKA
jgi:hypothetical protein